jgi:hypothetical protein
MFMKDPNELAPQFRAWGAIADLKRILVSHGDLIDRSPGEVLNQLHRTSRANRPPLDSQTFRDRSTKA